MSELQSILELDVEQIRSQIRSVLDQEMGRARDTLERDLVTTTTKRVFDLFQSNAERIEDELWDYEIETEELISFFKTGLLGHTHGWFYSNDLDNYKPAIDELLKTKSQKLFVVYSGDAYTHSYNVFMYSVFFRVSQSSGSSVSFNYLTLHSMPKNILLSIKLSGRPRQIPTGLSKIKELSKEHQKPIFERIHNQFDEFIKYFKAHPEYFLEQSPAFNTIVQREHQEIQRQKEELRKERALLDLDLDVFQRQKAEFLQSYRDVEGFEQERKEFEEERKRMALVKIALHRERQSIEQEREALRKEREALQEAQSEGINLDEYFKDITTDVAATTKNIFQSLKTRII